MFVLLNTSCMRAHVRKKRRQKKEEQDDICMHVRYSHTRSAKKNTEYELRQVKFYYS